MAKKSASYSTVYGTQPVSATEVKGSPQLDTAIIMPDVSVEANRGNDFPEFDVSERNMVLILHLVSTSCLIFIIKLLNIVILKL